MPNKPIFRNVDIVPSGGDGDDFWKKWLGIFGCIVLVAMYFSSKPTQDKEPVQQPKQQTKQTPQIQFAALGPRKYPSPNPDPVFVGRHPTNGDLVFGWGGKRWILPDVRTPYRYHCVMGGQLQWCAPSPPNASATACTRGADNAPGWCWKE